METKVCKTCKSELPKTKEYFNPNGKYFKSYCRKCSKKKNKKWKENNPEKHLEGVKNWQKNNLKKHKENFKKWKENNFEKHKESIEHWKYKKQGVYAIFSSNKCLYVGESKQLLNRISYHKTHIKNPETKTLQTNLYNNLRQYSNLEFKILEETEDHKIRETYWINKLNPIFNEYLITT